MSLFSFLRKNKQETTSDSNAFQSRAEGESKPTRKRKRGGQGEEPMDPVLPEKKRARRRLIGAIALVLAAIIGLPMVFDSEPKPLAEDIAIQIPSKDRTPPVERPAAPKIAAADALDPKEEVVEPSAPEVGAKAPAADTAPTPKAPEQTAKAAAKEKPATLPPVAKAVDKPHPSAETKSDDAARAKALLEGKSDPKAEADKKPNKFVIQVAALATKEKVAELQNRLQDAGIKSYTQKVATASGDRIRIRVGPFTSREEADKMRAKIVKLGLNGTIVPT